MSLLRKIFLASLLLGLAACGPASPEESTPTAVPENTADEPETATSDSDSAEETAVSTDENDEETAVAASPIDDEEARSIMFNLTEGSINDIQAALARILAAEDQRFVSVLIELMRGRQIGLIQYPEFDEIVSSLETLSGQSWGENWGDWIMWYGSTDLIPPPGFTSWKGRLLAGIDNYFGLFLQDSHPSRIRVEEVQWGGVVLDGIPALDNPNMLTATEEDYLEPWEPVFGIAINGDVRAYPLRILDWHEMANDVVGGVPVSLAYCTLCGAAVAYDGRSVDLEGNEVTYTFGSSGFLFRSNKLMYDRSTFTLWNQLTGEPVLGDLAAGDIRLNLLPVVLTTWADWQEQHPETLVVDMETGFNRLYVPGAAYGDYFANDSRLFQDGLMFPVWQQSDQLFNKDHVYALRIDETPKAYPVIDLLAERVVNDVVGETAVTLVAAGEIVEVEGISQRIGPVTYTSGAEIRTFARGEHSFSPGANDFEVVDEDGRPWQVTEEALIGPDGETLARINGHLAYWFGWYAFYPETELYQP
ncbi:DUF3179 domain-containing protein [Candidatus Leptofilum sp.]|uniref:DUF3179 domain-containing protein n=1 Tax=Candidatus Leptofilum sp. TaxID=3241576 RepID=UPI003B5B4D2D